MAKASEADLNMAMKLANYLDAIDRGQMPDDLSEDAESIEWLDEDDRNQYAKLLDGLRRLLNQGSISRVIWGMAVVCDPANKCIDPDADTIEHHPDLVKAAEQRDELQNRLDAYASGTASDCARSAIKSANEFMQQRDELQTQVDRYEETLTKIRQWCEAYPLDIFPEPDLIAARRGLASVGITLDSVSASNMRHVLAGVQKIIGAAVPPAPTSAG